MIPVLSEVVRKQVEAIKDLVLAEVNVKELEFMTEDAGQSPVKKSNPISKH